MADAVAAVIHLTTDGMPVLCAYLTGDVTMSRNYIGQDNGEA